MADDYRNVPMPESFGYSKEVDRLRAELAEANRQLDYLHNLARFMDTLPNGTQVTINATPEAGQYDAMRAVAKRLYDGWKHCVSENVTSGEVVSHHWHRWDGDPTYGVYEPMTDAEVRAIDELEADNG